MNIKTIKTLTYQAIIASSLTLSTCYAAEPVAVIDSGNDGNPPANTLDNDLSTRWSANGNDGSQWLQYDFGSATDLSGVSIAFYKGDSRSTYFKIESSTDANLWTPQIDTMGSGSTADLEDFSFATDISARYIRYVGYGNSSNTWNSVTEIDFIDGNVTPIDAVTVPALIQAEDYDDYNDTTAGNNGGQYSNDDVDVQVTSDTGGGYNVGWVKSTEWLDYDINVTSAGSYTADIRLAARKATGSFNVLVDGSITDSVALTATGGWQSWETTTVDLGELSAGVHTIRLDITGDNFNINWIDIQEEADVCDVTPDHPDCNYPCLAIECNSDLESWYGDDGYWDLEGGEDDLSPVVGNTFVFDALAAQHVTSNGNGWRHELKIRSDLRVAMTDVYEDFSANIKLDISDGSKMIVIQHHAEDTGTIMKLYVADSSESDIGDSEPGDGVFGVYVRLRNEDGNEEKKSLGTIVSGDDFDFRVINNYGHVTVTAMGETFSLTIDDSDNSYLKFGNYLQAQYADGLANVDDSDDWAAFYEAEGITESKLTFSNPTYLREVGGGDVPKDDDNDGVLNDDDDCPNTPAGTQVDSNGCAVIDTGDDDNDGVINEYDNCPNTPAGSTVDSNGCEITPIVCDNGEICWGGFVGNGTVTNTSPEDLSETLQSAKAGDEIIVTGSADEISIKDVSFSSLVLVRAENIGGTTLTSIALTRTNNIIFGGFVFGPNEDASTLFKITDSTNIKILRNVFDHKDVTTGQNSIIMAGPSQFIEIGYNTFRDKNVTHREGGKNTGSFIKYQFETGAGMTKDTHVHHNYFKNIPAYVATGNSTPEGDSDREAIVMGIADSQSEVTNNLVEYNLFENCDGENEIITVKTSGNEFSNNTFVNSMGSLSFRLGHSNVAHSNQFYGSGASDVWTDENYQTGGIRVYGEGHEIYNNYMEGLTGESWRLPLLLDNGDTSSTIGNDSHQTPTNVLVSNNTVVNSNGGVHVGRASNTKYKNAPHSNTITNNTVVGSQGNLFENDAEQSTNVWSGNEVYKTGSAVANSGGTLSAAELTVLNSTPSISAPTPLTASDVGPNASE